MAEDLKYGKVTLEHGDIGDEEPVVVFRANDKLLPELLVRYWSLCDQNDSPERHLELILETRQRVIEWQEINGSRVPNSEASREWLGR